MLTKNLQLLLMTGAMHGAISAVAAAGGYSLLFPVPQIDDNGNNNKQQDPRYEDSG